MLNYLPTLDFIFYNKPTCLTLVNNSTINKIFLWIPSVFSIFMFLHTHSFSLSGFSYPQDPNQNIAHSAVAVEYTDYFPAEG